MSTTKLPFTSTIERWISLHINSHFSAFEPASGITATTSRGLVRSENQDRVALFRLFDAASQRAIVASVIADGIGGAVGGGDAAGLALAAFAEALYVYNDSQSLAELATTAALHANRAVFERLRGRGGTTLAAILCAPNGDMVMTSVGDSRVYAASTSSFAQLTIDDTIAGRAIDAPHNLSLSPNSLLQFVGMGDGVRPSTLDISQLEDQKFLLLTDGVYGASGLDLATLLSNASEPTKLARRLTAYSEWAGGIDNATALVAEGKALRGFTLSALSSDADYIESWAPNGLLVVLLAQGKRAKGKQKTLRGKAGRRSSKSPERSGSVEMPPRLEPLIEIQP